MPVCTYKVLFKFSCWEAKYPCLSLFYYTFHISIGFVLNKMNENNLLNASVLICFKAKGQGQAPEQSQEDMDTIPAQSSTQSAPSARNTQAESMPDTSRRETSQEEAVAHTEVERSVESSTLFEAPVPCKTEEITSHCSVKKVGSRTVFSVKGQTLMDSFLRGDLKHKDPYEELRHLGLKVFSKDEIVKAGNENLNQKYMLFHNKTALELVSSNHNPQSTQHVSVGFNLI